MKNLEKLLADLRAGERRPHYHVWKLEELFVPYPGSYEQGWTIQRILAYRGERPPYQSRQSAYTSHPQFRTTANPDYGTAEGIVRKCDGGGACPTLCEPKIAREEQERLYRIWKTDNRFVEKKETAMTANDRMLRLTEIVELTGLSKASVYRRMKDSNFPKPRAMGPRAVRWSAAAVESWLCERPRLHPPA